MVVLPVNHSNNNSRLSLGLQLETVCALIKKAKLDICHLPLLPKKKMFIGVSRVPNFFLKRKIANAEKNPCFPK